MVDKNLYRDIIILLKSYSLVDDWEGKYKMKIKNLFVSIALGLVASAGLALSLSAGSEAEAVKATDLYEGSVFIQKNDNDMKYTGSKLVAYFFDNEEPQNKAWGEAVSNTGNTYQEYSWSLSFEPTTFIVLRVDGENWSSANPWSNVWCRTGDVSLAGTDVLWMEGNSSESSGWGTYSMETSVMSDSDVELQKLAYKKIKDDKEGLEAFGEVSLAAEQKFYIKKTIDGDAKYTSYTCLDLIASNLSIEDGYIKVDEAATYEFYFDFNGKSLYITDPAVAAADEWAQDFLNGGCEATKSGWNDSAEDFDGLSEGAQNIIKGQEHVEHSVVLTDFVERAVQRYDYVLERYGVYDAIDNPEGYTDFLGRVDSGKVIPGPSARITFNNIIANNSTMIIVIIAASVAVAAIGAIVLIKKKHQ